MDKDRKRVVLNDKSRQIVKHVLDVCEEEAANKALIHPVSRPLDRASSLTGVSKRTLSRLKKQTPTPEIRKHRQDKIVVDDFDICVIRRTVSNMYSQKKTLPTIRSIQEELQETIGFKGKREVLRKILKQIGFTWKKCASNRLLLMERPDVAMSRIRYLREIKHLREAGHPIVYMDETYVNASHTVPKCWQMDNIGMCVPFGKGERLIIVNAGSEKGFVPGASLVFKAHSSSGDYHSEMNGHNFEKWLTERLIPNLEEHSVLVIDNASYHNVQEEKRPTTATRKKDIQDWLIKHKIEFAANMLRPQLLELCKEYRVPPTFQIDKLMTAHGHKVVRLPPYHADLNPIELIWAELKNHIDRKNLKFRMSDVKALVGEKMAAITESEWSKCVAKVKATEEQYRKAEIATDEAVEEVIISLGSSESDDESTDTADEESDVSTVSGSDSTDSVDESTDTADEKFTVVNLYNA